MEVRLMASAVLEEKFHTIEDIYALPEGTRAELIDGRIYDMAPPSTRHQRILSFLHLEIGNSCTVLLVYGNIGSWIP